MARLNKQDLVIKGNRYFKYIYKVEAIYFSGKRSLYYTKLDDVKKYVNKYVGKNDNLYLVNIHRYDVKSIMSKYMAEYKQYNLAYLLFITDRDDVFTFVTGWNMQGWINGGIDALEEIEQEQPAKEEQKAIEQPKEEQEPIKEEQPKEKYFTVVKDGEILTRENNFQDCINFIRADVEKSNATTFEYIVKMHHDIIEVVAVVNKNNIYIYRDTRNKTIKSNPLFNKAYQILGYNDFDNAIMTRYLTPSIYEELPLREIRRCILDAEPMAYYSKLLNAYLLITVVPLNKTEQAKLKIGDNTALVRIKSIGKIGLHLYLS